MEDSIQDRIAWNSALNNAVNIIGACFKKDNDFPTPEKAMAFIEEWQLCFYKNLTERPKPKVPMSAREVAQLTDLMDTERVRKHFDVRDAV